MSQHTEGQFLEALSMLGIDRADITEYSCWCFEKGYEIGVDTYSEWCNEN